MIDSLRIEPAKLEDMPVLLPLLSQFFQEGGFEKAFERLPMSLPLMLSDPGSAVFLARDGLKAVGVATVTTTSRGLEFAKYSELEDLYVIPEARSKGVDKALIDAVKHWCDRHQCSVLSVIVTPKALVERDLVSYYLKHGFQKSDRTTLFYFFDD